MRTSPQSSPLTLLGPATRTPSLNCFCSPVKKPAEPETSMALNIGSETTVSLNSKESKKINELLFKSPEILKKLQEKQLIHEQVKALQRRIHNGSDEEIIKYIELITQAPKEAANPRKSVSDVVKPDALKRLNTQPIELNRGNELNGILEHALAGGIGTPFPVAGSLQRSKSDATDSRREYDEGYRSKRPLTRQHSL